MRNVQSIQKKMAALRNELSTLERQLRVEADGKLHKRLSDASLWEVSWNPPGPRIVIAHNMTEAKYWGRQEWSSILSLTKVHVEKYKGESVRVNDIAETDEVYDIREELEIDDEELKKQLLSKNLSKEAAE